MDKALNEFNVFKSLRVDPNDTVTKIKKVRTGSKTDQVAILIQ